MIVIQNIQSLLKTQQLKKKKTIKKWACYLNRHSTKEDIKIANKHRKRCSTSYVIKELQVKHQ